MLESSETRGIDTTSQARPAILIAGPRTGGTFLCCCLSNHPQVFCTRGEPMHWGSRWLHAVPDWKVRFDLLMRQPLYEVSLFKAMGHNIFSRLEVWEFLQEYSPDLRVIYLERENILYQAVSRAINVLHRQGELPGHPTHTFISVSPEPCHLDPQSVRRWYNRIQAARLRHRKLLAEGRCPVLYLTYEEVARVEGVMSAAAARRICNFLGIDELLLSTALKKVHTVPYEELILNWQEIYESFA